MTLYQKINYSFYKMNPYMSLAYLYSLVDFWSDSIQPYRKEIYNKFTLFMMRSVNFMIPYVRNAIKNRIFYLVYYPNSFFNSEVFSLKFWLAKELNKYKIPKKRQNDKNVRKFIYFFTHYMKNKQYNY
jgi:hypothetical protein